MIAGLFTVELAKLLEALDYSGSKYHLLSSTGASTEFLSAYSAYSAYFLSYSLAKFIFLAVCVKVYLIV